MMTPCTSIMAVEMKRSGWISGIFQRRKRQKRMMKDTDSGEGPGSVKADSQEFGSPRGIGVSLMM